MKVLKAKLEAMAEDADEDVRYFSAVSYRAFAQFTVHFGNQW
jgi:hypothetical protein